MKTDIRKFFESYSSVAPGRVKTDVSMTSHTTFHCRGAAEIVYLPRNREDLSHLVAQFKAANFVYRKDWLVMGRGSNVLVADEGYHGCIIDLSGDFHRIDVLQMSPAESILIKVDAGVSNGTLLQYLRNNNWSGFEFAFGIPGCIGGGIRMNAGTPQGWFSEILEKVELMDLNGKIKEFVVDPGHFAYRDFPMAHQSLILSGTFLFQKSPHFVIQEKVEAMKSQRKNQPLEFPNTGSVFKNPEGNFAGKLIEEAGLKGFRIGDAQISDKHANFIVNLGNAKTSDALALIRKAKEEVQNKFGILLEQEVHCIGECSA